MLLLVYGYLFNFFFYSVSVFIALLIIGKLGKVRPSGWQERAVMAVVCGAGVTLIQLISHAATVIYVNMRH
ncbi:hypothetical protein SDC9_194498 [bioreactor metagenome]|jgi:hypothetical protein|uniref:Uncharacterized protein n=1 Tax=bioreactor metagenome TaxID=1076179 RepID=A0A645I8Z4_9ZZZZ